MNKILFKNLLKILFYTIVGFVFAYWNLLYWFYSMIYFAVITVIFLLLLKVAPFLYHSHQINKITNGLSSKSAIIGYMCCFIGECVGALIYLLISRL